MINPEGTNVGTLDIFDVGEWVGLKVRAIVYTKVGADDVVHDGSKVGSLVGTLDGSLVGEAVGY